VQKVGYEPQTLPVAISAKDTTPITLILRRVTQLPTMVTRDSAAHYISPALRGFEERRKSEAGYFVDETVLRKNDGHRLADVLRARAPSATFHDGPNGATYLLKSMRCTSGGPPQVYLDGVPLASIPTPDMLRRPGGRVPAPETPPFDLSLFPVDQLAAVEWYPDETVAPMQFSHTSQRCGSLLLWTRER
jgi:hypothetical protein